jgi:hypothetical protein
MRLATFFARIGPLLEGRISVEEARRALFGDGTAGPDARRLAIYERFCRGHRFAALEAVYAHCREAVVRTRGGEAWERVVDGYFAAHPMHHVELNQNGDALGAFLDDSAADIGLPEWLSALADFEWWEWRTRVAPDAPEDAEPRRGPLRIASTVELRPYRWDFVGWLDGAPPSERAPAPDERARIVLFWRDLELDPRRENADPLELGALQAASQGRPLAPPPPGVDERAWDDTVRDLREAGILLGE